MAPLLFLARNDPTKEVRERPDPHRLAPEEVKVQVRYPKEFRFG